MVFKTNYHLMQVKSIVECSKGSILQYFRPSLSYHLSIRYLCCLFLSGRLRQGLLYALFQREVPNNQLLDFTISNLQLFITVIGVESIQSRLVIQLAQQNSISRTRKPNTVVCILELQLEIQFHCFPYRRARMPWRQSCSMEQFAILLTLNSHSLFRNDSVSCSVCVKSYASHSEAKIITSG